MLYFSQLKNIDVYTDNNLYVGKLEDIIFLASVSPIITKIVIKQQKNSEITIPVENIKKVNSKLTISRDFKTIEEKTLNELSIDNNLQDKQIIDVEGNKVIRVNDVIIQDQGKDKPLSQISGVDIGIRGMLRWLKMENIARPLFKLLGKEFDPHYLSWADIQPLELTKGSVQLKSAVGVLDRMRPEDLADYLEKTTIKNIRRILNNLDEKYAVDVINNLTTSYQAALFQRFNTDRSAKLIELIDPDEAVDILLTLNKEKREEILSKLAPAKRKQIEELLKLSKTPIGALINTEYFTLSTKDNVKSALNKVKEDGGIIAYLPYIYILNENNELVGVIKMVDLLINKPETLIVNIMKQNLVVIHLSTPQEIALKKMLRYKIYVLPVSDGERHILGVVLFNDLAESILGEYV